MADSRHIPSKRFADSPKDILAVAPLYARPASELEGYLIPDTIRIKRYPARRAMGSHTWRIKGGMIGGVSSHLGTVPQAFFKA